MIDDHEFFPLHTLKDRDIEAAIWELPTSRGPSYSVRVSRVYRADGESKYSNLFSPDELLRVAKITTDAYTWLTNYRNDPYQQSLDEYFEDSCLINHQGFPET